MSEDIAIKLQGVKKQYRLGQIGGGTLQGDLQSWWARKRGKEDPNTKIGTDQRLIGQTFMALNGIDLEIPKGQAIGIIGKNGAGKSTMLKLLCRVTAPTEGTIDIYGRIASMLEVGTGFHPEMTGRENVYMNGAILGMTKAEIDAKMDQIIEFSEVGEFIDTPVKRYSSGMYVKLAFSVAAHLESEIMIMDEVLAVGDVNFQQKCIQKMRNAASAEGKTVLYVSHNMATIKKLCSRCIVLKEGRIIFDGNVDKAIEIYSSDSVQSNKTQYDFSKYKRRYDVTNIISINKININNNLKIGEPLKLTVVFFSIRNIQHAMVRFVLFDIIGNTIGTAYSEMFDLQKGINKVELEFDCDSLMSGDYSVDLIVIEFEDDKQIRHDIINQAFSFTIEESEIYYNMNWNRLGWGSIKFHDLKVVGKSND